MEFCEGQSPGQVVGRDINPYWAFKSGMDPRMDVEESVPQVGGQPGGSGRQIHCIDGPALPTGNGREARIQVGPGRREIGERGQSRPQALEKKKDKRKLVK